MSGISKWVPLPLPTAPKDHQWMSRVWDNDGHPCAEFMLVKGAHYTPCGQGRIDLEMYGHNGVRERAQRIIDDALGKKPIR